jgi:hypothetical protein
MSKYHLECNIKSNSFDELSIILKHNKHFSTMKNIKLFLNFDICDIIAAENLFH